MISTHMSRTLLLASSMLFTSFTACITSSPAFAQEADGDSDDARKPVDTVVVTAQRLDAARAAIEPDLGASTYALSNDAVENRPGSETTTINQVMLQMPGVVQAGPGQIQVRGSGDLQYRINNVIVPEGLSDLGETLSPRIADKIELVTGALPAQYGLQVTGVVNITTKSGAYEEGGQAEIYGGSHSKIEPAVEYAGSFGGTNLFLTGDYLHSNRGLPSPDGRSDPLHDTTDQIDGLAYVDRVINDNSRVSFVAGSTSERFQIPDFRGLDAQSTMGSGFLRPLTLNGTSAFASDALNETQKEQNHFAIASYLLSDDDWTLQASLFGRFSKYSFAPDARGDFLFYGSSQTLNRQDMAQGIQIEGSVLVDTQNTVRAGLVASTDRTKFDDGFLVAPVDPLGHQTAAPFSLSNRVLETDDRISTFVQDEWHPMEGLTLNGGLRLDYVHERTGTAQLSPRLNAVFTPDKDTVFHVGYARYFVPAPLDESDDTAKLLSATSGRYPAVAGNPTRAETDDYFDIGVRRAFEDISLGLDSYWRAASNLLDSGTFAGSPVAQSFNFRHGDVAGVELSANYADGPWTAWSNLSLSTVHATVIAANQFLFTSSELAQAANRHVPLSTDQTVTLSMGASYRWQAFLFSGDVTYGSGLRSRIIASGFSGQHLGDHVQLDLAGVYHLALDRDQVLDLRLDLINLTDGRTQLQDGNGPGSGLPQWGPRREIYAGIEAPF